VFSSVRELGVLVRSRKVSPVELAETFMRRLETLGPRYNAVVTVTRERAMEQARRAEAEITAGNYRGALHGIPYGAKDLLATSGGIPTTWGAAPFRDQTFDYDATVVRRLEEAGAVLVAKLAMVELAGGMGHEAADASFTGPGLNPWNVDRWAGGSSSGSGSAVSAGLVPFAIGSETWGSILIPANNCGIAGLRPTYGRVSRHGAMALSWTLDKLGPLCLAADDCGLVLEAIAGHDPDDPSTTRRPYRYEAGPEGRRFRLGVLAEASRGATDEVAANFQRALSDLHQVADVEEVELPEFPYEAVARTILHTEVASSFDEFIESGGLSELTAPEGRYGPYAHTAVLATDYLRALRLRSEIGRQVDAILAKYDAIVAPTSRTVAQPLHSLRGGEQAEDRPPDYMGAIGNACGLPAISVPSGFSGEGLPTGIQFLGRAYDENAVIAVARAYQTLTDWHTRHPRDVGI
jgi:aspartyl-tRNA(Asn)/glutamyl-tRNA(Gln) amidotransferase subunit A